MSLRTTLIIIGVAIVLAVYAVTALRRRREARASYRRNFSRLDIPDVILQHEEEDDVPGEAAGYAPRLPEEVVLPGVRPRAEAHRPAEPDEPLPVVRNDARTAEVPSATAAADAAARRRADQMDLFGAPQDAAPARPEPPPPPPAPPPPATREQAPATRAPAASPPAGLITLYLSAPAKREVRGTDLVRALNGVGMRFGEMAIFHHHGPGDLNCETPVFSAANMFEPGTFDLARIEAFRTSGIVLFLQLPGPLDGPVAFELLLNTAQRIAELTGMELRGDPRTKLDAATIARLRERAAHFGHARA